MYCDTFGYALNIQGYSYIISIHCISNMVRMNITQFIEYCRSRYKIYSDPYKFYFYNKDDAQEVLDWIISVVTIHLLAGK